MKNIGVFCECYTKFAQIVSLPANIFSRYASGPIEVHPGHIPMHAVSAVFICIFIPVLSRSYFTCRTPNKDQKINQHSSTLFSFKSHNPETSMSFTVNGFVHAIRKRLKKCLVQKVGDLGSLHLIPMNEQPFNSS